MGQETLFFFFFLSIEQIVSCPHNIHPSIHPYICWMDGWMDGWMVCYSAAGPLWLWKVCDSFTTWFYITTLPEKKVQESKWLTSCDDVCLTQQNGSQYVIGCSYVVTFLHFVRLHVRLFVSHDLREQRRKSLYIKKKRWGWKRTRFAASICPSPPNTRKKKKREDLFTPWSDFSLVAWKFYSYYWLPLFLSWTNSPS